jgi:hypothetical protein
MRQHPRVESTLVRNVLIVNSLEVSPYLIPAPPLCAILMIFEGHHNRLLGWEGQSGKLTESLGCLRDELVVLNADSGLRSVAPDGAPPYHQFQCNPAVQQHGPTHVNNGRSAGDQTLFGSKQYALAAHVERLALAFQAGPAPELLISHAPFDGVARVGASLEDYLHINMEPPKSSPCPPIRVGLVLCWGTSTWALRRTPSTAADAQTRPLTLSRRNEPGNGSRERRGSAPCSCRRRTGPEESTFEKGQEMGD